MRIKLASYNIQYGVGKDGRLDLGRIASELGDADVVALQEVESHNPQRGMIDQPAELSELLAYPHWTYGPGIDVYLSAESVGGRSGRRHRFGNMILSRWPILSVVTHTLPKLALKGALHLQCTLIETVIETPVAPLRFCCTHLSHSSPMTRMPQVKALQAIMLDADERGAPWGGVSHEEDGFGDRSLPWPSGGIIMGDMNFAPDSSEYTFLVGDVSPMLGRRISLANGLFDAWVLVGHAESEGRTFVKPGRPELRLDYCFVTSDYVDAVQSMRIDETAVGSDHQPIFVDLELGGDLQ